MSLGRSFPSDRTAFALHQCFSSRVFADRIVEGGRRGKRYLHPKNTTYVYGRADVMSDTALAYLISLGIIGVGVIWIFAGANSATSTIWIAIGILTLAVGSISFLTELRNGKY
jgi:hypothetical protein